MQHMLDDDQQQRSIEHLVHDVNQQQNSVEPLVSADDQQLQEEPINTYNPNQEESIESCRPPKNHVTLPRRTWCAPSRLQDYYCDSVLKEGSSTHTLSKVISYDSLSSPHKMFSMVVTSLDEPRTYNQAIKHESWSTPREDSKHAMAAEIKALQVLES